MPDNRDPVRVLKKLHTEMVNRRPIIAKTQDYYDGAHNLAFASEKFLEAFGGLFRAFADNWCGVVANAVDERLKVQGFRVGAELKADADAKRMWEENELDLQSSMGHLDALIAGAFYVTVWTGEAVGDKAKAEITVESAANTIVECHPKIRKRRTAGLRSWLADDGYEHAELFFPEEVYLFRSKSKRGSGGMMSDPMRSQWVIEDQLDVASELDESGAMPNPYGVVPIVEFLNRARLTRSPRAGWAAHSEIASVIPLQDAVNKLMADLMVASEFAAFPQRHLTGYEPADEVGADGKPTGKIKEPNFKSGPGGMFWVSDEGAEFGQFDAANLSETVKAIDMVVQHIASISATPPHYLRASADRLSGESITSAETGLVAKCIRKQDWFGAGWEEVMRIGGKVEGITALASAIQMETIWRDPATRTESEHIDALIKKKALDVPAPQLWEEASYTDEQTARFPAMRAQMQLEGLAAVAGERARLATEEATRLAQANLDATGALPPAVM